MNDELFQRLRAERDVVGVDVLEARGEKSGTRAEVLWGSLVLAISAAVALLWICVRLLEIDEYLSFYTDSQPTMARVLGVQLHYPISLDPPVYHLLSHLAMRLVGAGAVALRLPALAGFLLFQFSLLVFVRRLAGWRAAVVAAAVPFGTASFFYAVQGRPYGLLMGLYGLAFVLWQTASAPLDSARSRLPSVLGLAAVIVLAVNSHYFGILVLLPICAGELVRTLKTRRFDWPVVAALAGGGLSAVLVIPFQKAAVAYRTHYYMTSVSWRMALQAYPALLYAHHTLPPRWQQPAAALLTLMEIVAVAAGLWWFSRRSRQYLPHAVALTVLILLPFAGLLIGKYITHTIDVRYLVPILFGLVVFVAVSLENVLRRRAVFVGLMTVLLALGVQRNLSYARGSLYAKEDLPQRFVLSPEVASALRQHGSSPIYMQSLGDFYKDAYYEPDRAIGERFSLVYSQDAELGWLKHDTNYLTARNMEHFAPLTMSPYSALLSGTDRHPLVLQYRDGWDWLGKDLDARGVPYRTIGQFMGGELDELQLDDAPQPAMAVQSATAGRNSSEPQHR